MNIRITLLALLLPASLFAQRNVSIRPQRASTEEIVSQMFRLDPRAANHSLTAHLPGDALLTIESPGVSYWPGRTELARIAQLAAGAVHGVQDSFRSATSEKLVAIYLPVDDGVQTVQYAENFSNANLVVRSSTTQAALKVGFDTLRILKAYGMKARKKDSALPQQIQYTFVMKSLADFESIVAGEALLDDVARTMDSVVTVQKRRWGRDDAWYHSLEAVYRPEMARDDEARLVVRRGADAKGNKGFSKGVEGAVAIEVTLLNSALAPGLTAGFGYRWPKPNRRDEFKFLRLSTTTLFHFNPKAVFGADTFTSVEPGHIFSLEYGTVFNRANTLLPLYRTSVGVGWAFSPSRYAIVPNTHPFGNGAVRVFLTYSASKLITIVPQIYFGGRTVAPYTVGVRFGL